MENICTEQAVFYN